MSAEWKPIDDGAKDGRLCWVLTRLPITGEGCVYAVCWCSEHHGFEFVDGGKFYPQPLLYCKVKYVPHPPIPPKEPTLLEAVQEYYAWLGGNMGRYSKEFTAVRDAMKREELTSECHSCQS